ncbi:MAG TPA: amidohydrolase family protein [Acidimicrobiales bacterium]|nr:amidohydrolase family protein [Acidimicrobiales bacterium]
MTDATEEASRPDRIVDAHVHFWDPTRTDWYPYLGGGQDVGLGDVTGMARHFDLAAYRAESPGWNVQRFVHVAAATGTHSIEETLELDARAQVDGHPDALIGGITATDSVVEAVDQLDRQLRAGRLRGVRPMGRFEAPLPHRDVLAALAERDLIFELMARPDQLGEAAAGLADRDRLTVVVEHAGWPRSGDAAERALWRDGLRALAEVGENVHCKISGLAMPLGSMDPDVLRPWVQEALALFGTRRCFFASNFPVDGLHGTLDELWSSYSALTADLDAATRDALFAGNAERVYRL